MHRIFRIVSAMFVLLTAANAFSQEPKTEKPVAPAGIRELLMKMEDSFAQGDAKALAACWAEDGDFTGPTGERVEGRGNLEKAFQAFLKLRTNAVLHLHVVELRLVNDDVALVDAIALVTPSAAPPSTLPTSSLTLAKHDGRWLIASARESSSIPPPPAEHLKDLEWLVGDWTDDPASTNPISLHSSCDWTINHSFLIRKFRTEGKNVPLHAGTEVIGWDARTQRIRSWMFDSEGGFGENVWVHSGKRWLIKYNGTLADGAEVSATHILAFVDENTVTLQSVDRMVNGALQPDISEVVLKRQITTKQAVKPGTQTETPKHVLP